MAGELDEAMRAEVEDLARRYGEPLRVEAPIRSAAFDPIRRGDRVGEVCMVIRRPNGTVLLSTKDFYPRGAYRLPTGGIDPGEAIGSAVAREAHEETGLVTEVRRFLAAISYRPARTRDTATRAREDERRLYERSEYSRPTGGHVFHTFAFLLDELGGTLGSLDPHERILDYREVAPSELSAVADRLEGLASEHSTDIGGDWAEWGRFRAVVHRAVARALA